MQVKGKKCNDFKKKEITYSVLVVNLEKYRLDGGVKQSDPNKIKYGFTYTGFGYDREKPYEYLFNHDVYMYATNEELKVTIPIEHIWRMDIAKYQISGVVQIGGIIKDMTWYIR